MRAYLSSYRLGTHFEQFLALVPTKPKVLLVTNALDVFSDASRRRHRAEVYDPNRELEELGCSVSDLDLRAYFGRSDALKSRLVESDFVWVLGGNSFVLKRAMHLSGFDDLVTEQVKTDAIAYGGFSAGAVVAAPTLDGIHLMDNPEVAPQGYPSEITWKGLGLVDFAIVPHWRSDHPEAAEAELARTYLQDKGLPHKTLSDGQALLLVNDAVSLLS
ncbi:MAG: Type 1 glutamine amidotransferase-like domain-containing protein [Pseudomonadota bacterium]